LRQQRGSSSFIIITAQRMMPREQQHWLASVWRT
jgi:hypothetical protein